jgi:hypothetical protein
VLIGELASRDTAESEALEQLAKLAERIPNAQLQVYWLGDVAESPPAPDDVQKLISEASAIFEQSPRGSFLLAWAGLEAAITRFSSELKLQADPSSWRAATNLYSLGYVDEADFEQLSKLWRARNEIAHNASPHEPTRDDVSFVLDVAMRMTTGEYVSADDMVDWLLERYEDPANQLPYDSAEGGYQYQGDGPYDAEELLREQFPRAADRTIEQAVRVLNDTSIDWIRKRGGAASDVEHG